MKRRDTGGGAEILPDIDKILSSEDMGILDHVA